MAFRSELMRNLRILGLISICFTAGVFVAEYVGKLLQPEEVEAISTESGELDATANESSPAAEVATLPEAAEHAP